MGSQVRVPTLGWVPTLWVSPLSPLGVTAGTAQPLSPRWHRSSTIQSHPLPTSPVRQGHTELSPNCPWVGTEHRDHPHGVTGAVTAGYQARGHLLLSPDQNSSHRGEGWEGSNTGIQNQTSCEEDTAGDTTSLRDMSHIPVSPMSSPAPAQSCPLPGVFNPLIIVQNLQINPEICARFPQRLGRTQVAVEGAVCPL